MSSDTGCWAWAGQAAPPSTALRLKLATAVKDDKREAVRGYMPLMFSESGFTWKLFERVGGGGPGGCEDGGVENEAG